MTIQLEKRSYMYQVVLMYTMRNRDVILGSRAQWPVVQGD